MAKYSAILFACDGEYVVDYECDTVEQVQELLDNQGSRWFFYPFHAIVRSHSVLRPSNRLIEVAEPFQGLTGRTIKSMTNVIASMSDNELEALLS